MQDISVQRVGDPGASNLRVFEELSRRASEIERRAFERFVRRGYEPGKELDDWVSAEREVVGSWPAAELEEEDGKYSLSMTLPGYEPAEVQVTATPKEIVVHASTDHERSASQGNVLWTEFGSNEVIRRFELPEAIDVDKTTATLEKGMLKIGTEKATPANSEEGEEIAEERSETRTAAARER